MTNTATVGMSTRSAFCEVTSERLVWPTDLHSCLRQVDLHGQVLSREHVRVMRLRKGALQFLQLKQKHAVYRLILSSDAPLCFRVIEAIQKPSKQLHMWYLMQHVSTPVGHLQAKIHDKPHERLHTTVFTKYWYLNLQISVLDAAMC